MEITVTEELFDLDLEVVLENSTDMTINEVDSGGFMSGCVGGDSGCATCGVADSCEPCGS